MVIIRNYAIAAVNKLSYMMKFHRIYATPLRRNCLQLIDNVQFYIDGTKIA